MHLPAGYTKVLVERTYGLGLGDGGICWDIPTDKIPPELRAIGSRFIVVLSRLTDKPIKSMTADEMRKIYKISIERITDE